MDTKETNDLQKDAELEETLNEAAIETADKQQPDFSDELPEKVEPKTKRVKKITVEETEDKANAPEVQQESETIVDTTELKSEKEIEDEAKIGEKPIEETTHPALNSRKEIVDAFKVLIETANTDIKEKVDNFKQSFYKIQKQEIENARKAYVEAGNAIENLVAEEDLLEVDFKNLLSNWREKRATRLVEEEKQRKLNFEKKIQIIESIKALTDSTEDIGKNFPEFRRLQQSWKDTGAVSQDQVNELWKKYQMEVERFYDLLKINNEFREYDFKKNLETKTGLCESAEKLAEETDVVIAFRQLQKLHEDWRETGPVAKEFREDIWNRFKNASGIINKKHQDFFERLKGVETENQSQKTSICEKIEAIDYTQLKSYKDWDAKTAEIINLQGQWKAIGFAPKKVNVKVFERFRTACDQFFRMKSEFYKTSKDILSQNLETKKGLCEKAETLKDSTDWKTTADTLIQIQKEWKTLGPVPKKFSESIWKRFIAACDYFFEQKEKNAPSQKNEEQKNLTAKKELIEQMGTISPEMSDEEATKLLYELIAKWNAIGHVPFKEKDKVYKTWHDAVDIQMERLHPDKNNHRSSSNSRQNEDEGTRSQGKVLHERERLLRQFDSLTSEIKVTENNIGFFNTSKSGNRLLDEIQKKIETLKEERDTIYKKIKDIDEKL